MVDETIQDRSINVPCLCPAQGHEAGDTIVLRETLDFLAVRAVRYAAQIEQEDDTVDVSIPTLLAVMSEGYILHGVESWTLVDEKRKAVEVNKANVRKYLLGHMVAAQIVGDLADVMYRPQVFLPLAELARRSSQPLPTNESTSVPSGASSTSPMTTEPSPPESSTRSVTRPKRSKPSSITSTQTVSIGRTSRASDGAFTS